MADCARNTGDPRWEYDALLKGFEFVSDSGDDMMFDYYNGRLIALDRGEDPFFL
jgi:hypothetical protein